MFVVIENTPGYLPDSEPAEFETWDSAVDFAESLARELEEDGYLVWRAEAIGKCWTAHFEAIESTPMYQPRLGRFIAVERAEV